MGIETSSGEKEISKIDPRNSVESLQGQEAGALRNLEAVCGEFVGNTEKLNTLIESEETNTLSLSERQELSKMNKWLSTHSEELKVTLASIVGGALFVGANVGIQEMGVSSEDIRNWGAISSLFVLAGIIAALPPLMNSARR